MDSSASVYLRKGLTFIGSAEFDPMDQNRASPQQSASLEAPPQPKEPEINNSHMPVMRPHSRPVYPDVISVDVLDPKLSIAKDSSSKGSLPEEKDALLNSPPDTIQPGEVFAQPNVLERRLALVNILAPVSVNVPEKNASAAPQITTTKPRSEGKAIREKLSASDAKLTEVIKTALVGAKPAADANDRKLHHDVEGNSVLAGSSSSPNSPWSPEPTSAASDVHISSVGRPSLKEDDEELEAKAKDVLKSLRDLGYIIQDPSPPKVLNSGSAASIRSENLVVCQSCFKFKGRPCELKYVLSISKCIVANQT